RERAIVLAHTRRPNASDSLEVQRRMTWIAQPKLEVLSRELAYLGRQLAKSLTKAWGRQRPHRAATSADRPPLPSGGCRARPIGRSGHLPRSAGPKLRRPALLVAPKGRGT